MPQYPPTYQQLLQILDRVYDSIDWGRQHAGTCPASRDDRTKLEIEATPCSCGVRALRREIRDALWPDGDDSTPVALEPEGRQPAA